ncbi:SLC13 family permease [Actinobacillus equuli subsp. haemolyticus]|uniref:SLC13 family permease n=1 Tax=Actinobacillus equuli TaxID=718 RepID=UPI002441EABB|nr:SLC13 family permease [Actinobacillus equuli]WGE50502.1 SLC13 family permease [Actinobacillus equuli subsp. haemolyticus]WGE71634.1 SLC13 family permease [Actinobacillus equuli subsp. haemolyticus]
MQTIINYLPSFMQLPLFWVLAILAVAVVLFIQNKLRMDVIALMVLLAFSLSGILTTKEALAGFGDPNVILLALLYIIGDALARTGVANQMSDWLLRVAGASEAKVIALLMLSIGTLGAFMSSTGIVAIFIPVTLAICASLNISPRRLMMPLAVAGLISGMMTLIATAPNLVTHAELVKAGYEGFHFFSFTPIGALVLVLGILYMLAVRRWLDDGSVPVVASNEDSMAHLIEEYKLNGRAKMVVLSENSHFIGKTIDELNLRSVYQLNIIAIQRYKNFRHITLAAFGKDQLQKKDILLMDIGVDEARFVQLCEEFGMQPIELKGEYFSTQSKSVGMAELGVMPETETIGQTVDALNFRSNFGLSVVGIKREGQILQNNLLTETVKSGDILLVMGVWQKITAMVQIRKDFFLIGMPKESKQAVPAASQAPHALFALVIMIGLMISGVVPNVIAAFIACLLLGAFRCIDMKSAYESIHFPTLILVIGMMPFSLAMQKTGGVALMVEEFIHLTGGANTAYPLILIGLFALTAVVGLFISTSATAILMAPIAIEVARQLGYPPTALVMVVAIASSAAFMTPISPVNSMVVSLGNYRFSDFLKVGLPFTVITMLVTAFLVPILFP